MDKEKVTLEMQNIPLELKVKTLQPYKAKIFYMADIMAKAATIKNEKQLKKSPTKIIRMDFFDLYK